MKLDYECQSLRIDHPSVLVGLLQLRSAWGSLRNWAHPRQGRTFHQEPPLMSGSHHACMFENLRDIEFTSNFCREFLNNSRGWRDEYMSIGKFWGGHPEYSEYFLFANPDLTLVCLQIPESEEFAGVRMPSFVELGPLCTLVDKLISGPILTIHIPDSLVYYPWFSDEDYPSNFIYMLPPRPLGALGEEDDGDMALYEAEIVA